MNSFEKFKDHINFQQTLLTEKQCKNLYTSVIISENWHEIFSDIHQSDIPRRIKSKAETFLKNENRYDQEHLQNISQLIEDLSFQDSDLNTCKKNLCSKSRSIDEFIKNIENMCYGSLEKLNGEDIAKMFLSLAVGGNDLFEKNSQKLRYKERKAISQYYKSFPIQADPVSIAAILSLSKQVND
jgi:hypothetical protein